MSTYKFELKDEKLLTYSQSFKKRLFDIVLSLFGILIFFIVILVAWLVASIDTRSNGLFYQKRIGLHGKIFTVFKIKTMLESSGDISTVTTSNDPRITKVGNFFRRTKIDELPQLWNVFIGKMSFVGPRPDVSGFADKLSGKDALILSIRPGITGPAAIKYREEESILAMQKNPVKYNLSLIHISEPTRPY